MSEVDTRSLAGRLAAWMQPLFIFCLMFAVLLGSGLLVFRSLRGEVRHIVNDNLVGIATLKSGEIDAWLDDRMADARSLSVDSYFAREVERWQLAGAQPGVQRDQLLKRLGDFLGAHNFRSIVLYDRNGRMMLTVGLGIKNAEHLYPAIPLAIQTGEATFIDLHPHADSSFPVGLGFVSPLRVDEHNVGAVYFAEDPQRYLFPLLRSWPVPSVTAETLLVRRDQGEILFLNEPRFQQREAMKLRLPLTAPDSTASQAVKGRPGLIEHTLDYRGKPVLAYATRIGGTSWVLITKQDEDEAYELIDRVEQISLGIAVLVVLMGSSWFTLWRRRAALQAEAVLLQQRLTADELRMESEQRFRLVFEHTALGLVRNGLDGQYLEVNDAWCEMFGYTRGEVFDRRMGWQGITHPDDIEATSQLLRRLLAGEMESFNIELRYLRKDGKTLWGSVAVSLIRDEQRKPKYFVSAIQDVTEHKQSELQVHFMAYHDRLTRLPNRALLFDRLSQAVSHAKREGRHVALLYLDLDGFKGVNDQYGHKAGDSLLRMSAQRFGACVREVDTVARLGGDEFAIVLSSLDDPVQARLVAEKLIEAFAPPFQLPNGVACKVGVSIGISIYPEDAGEIDSLLSTADSAMYASKKKGKNTYTFYGNTPRTAGEAWIEFKDDYLVGVGEIDAQHRDLLMRVNRINDALHNDESHPHIVEMFEDMIVATSEHFETESRYMTRYKFPEQYVHEMEHAHLINEAIHLKSQLDRGGELLALQSMKDWLLNHINHSDKALGAFLAKRGVSH